MRPSIVIGSNTEAIEEELTEEAGSDDEHEPGVR
jgi:hypothetical protein